MITVREIVRTDCEWVSSFLIEHSGSTRVVTRGVMHEVDKLPGFVALYDGEREALQTYSYRGDELEVVTLRAAIPELGPWSQPIVAARNLACDLRCRRMWLITTNDNEPAIRFYERRGMHIVTIHRGAIAESRKLKPEIALHGVGGRPIEDESSLSCC